MRHFFFRVDGKGQLWRLELDQPGQNFGQLKESRMLDFFFSHLQRNTEYSQYKGFPYLSQRMHERYFVSCSNAPLVFNDLRDGELQFLCPDGEVARSLSSTFDPRQLHLSPDGKLFHPFNTKANEVLLALIESTTAQVLLDHVQEDSTSSTGYCITWKGHSYALQPLDKHSDSLQM